MSRYPEKYHSPYPLVCSLVEIKETGAGLLLGAGFVLILFAPPADPYGSLINKLEVCGR